MLNPFYTGPPEDQKPLPPALKLPALRDAVLKNGFEFKILQQRMTASVWNKVDTDKTDVVHYITPKFADFDRIWESLLMQTGRMLFITSGTTLSTVNKWMENDTSCDICYEDRKQHGTCPRCGCKYCCVCTFRTGLGTDFKFDASFPVKEKNQMVIICPQCQMPIAIDVMDVTALAMQYLDELPSDHQQFVRHLVKHDKNYQEKHSRVMRDQWQMKNQYQKGDTVTIKRLKSRSEWNGKLAKVIGPYNSDKNRWPVQIISDDKPSAFIQAKNLALHQKVTATSAKQRHSKHKKQKR